MPRNNQRVQGLSPLNKAFSAYPNCYISLHEGVTGTPATQATAADQVTSNGWSMTVESPNADQWNTATGAFQPPNPNNVTKRALSLARTANPTLFDTIFDVKGKASLHCFHLEWVGLPTNVGRVYSIDAAIGTPQVEMKYTLAGSLQFLYGDQAQTVATLSATNTEMILFIYVDARPGSILQFAAKEYTPGTKTLNPPGVTKNISAAVIPDITTDEYFSIGSTRTNTAPMQNAENISIRGVRIINFDQNPPADLDDLQDELAVNFLAATSR